MQTHDNELVGADLIQAEIAPMAAVGNYEAVRFNAMKHGILSKLTVLAHEDQTEFTDLLAALIEEHRPAGMTERYLVEELASIIWRKRRVLLAEGAAISQRVKAVSGITFEVRRGMTSTRFGGNREIKLTDDFGKIREEKWAGSAADDAIKMARTRRAITGHWMFAGCTARGC